MLEMIILTILLMFLLSASLFLLSSVKAPEKAQTMVFKELQHEDTNERINAVLR